MDRKQPNQAITDPVGNLGGANLCRIIEKRDYAEINLVTAPF